MQITSVIWLVTLSVFLIFDVYFDGRVTCCLLACLAALISSMADVFIWVQVLVFARSLALAGVYTLVVLVMKKRSKPSGRGIVISPIMPDCKGLVRIKGRIYVASSAEEYVRGEIVNIRRGGDAITLHY